MLNTKYLSKFLSPVSNELIPATWLLSNNYIHTTQTGFNHEAIGKIEHFFVCVDLIAEENASDFSEFRKKLYSLALPPNAAVADLGNLLPQSSIENRKLALKELISEFQKTNKNLLIFSNRQEIVSQYFEVLKDRKQKVALTHIDKQAQIYKTAHSSQLGLIGAEIVNKKSVLNDLAVLATQEYFMQESEKTFLSKNAFFEVRTAQIRQHVLLAEPFIREVDAVSFNLAAIDACAAPAQENASPNGLNSLEACQFFNFLGYSNPSKIIFLYGYREELDFGNKTAALLAQMFWYYIKSSALRIVEKPAENNPNFTRFIINQSYPNIQISYYKSKISQRWWIEIIREKQKPAYFPVAMHEYLSAEKNEIPDEWMYYFKKLEKS